MADFTPRSHLLESHTNNNLPWWQALAELIDNALDANAKSVSIIVAGKTLTVKDDGNGVEDVLSLFRLGEHKKSKSTKLGRYGVGAKDAWLSCSDVMKVTSVRHGVKTTLQIDYRSLIANNWQGDDPLCDDTELPDGTTLEFKLRADKRAPQRESLDTIGWVFTPAIKNGIQLLYGNKHNQRNAIKPFELPLLQDAVDSEFDIDGKLVHIRIGILADGCRMPRGPFWVAHGHRHICSMALGIKNGSSEKLGGVITLGEGWRLSRHKDDFTENTDRLEEAIFCRIQSIVEKASSIAETMELASLRTEIQSILDNALDRVREKRGKGASVGSIGPRKTGRERKNAASVDTTTEGSVELPGTKGRKSKIRGIKFDWREMDDLSLGCVDPIDSRVSLNTNNDFVRSLRDDGNALAQVLCVCSLIADHESRHNGSQKLLAFEYKDFAQAVGRLVSGVRHAKAV